MKPYASVGVRHDDYGRSYVAISPRMGDKADSSGRAYRALKVAKLPVDVPKAGYFRVYFDEMTSKEALAIIAGILSAAGIEH